MPFPSGRPHRPRHDHTYSRSELQEEQPPRTRVPIGGEGSSSLLGNVQAARIWCGVARHATHSRCAPTIPIQPWRCPADEPSIASMDRNAIEDSSAGSSRPPSAEGMRASLCDGEIHLRFPFRQDLVARARRIPGRRWDPNLRVWRIPDTPAARKAVRSEFGVVVEAPTASEGIPPTHPHPHPLVQRFDEEMRPPGLRRAHPQGVPQPRATLPFGIRRPDGSGGGPPPAHPAQTRGRPDVALLPPSANQRSQALLLHRAWPPVGGTPPRATS